MSLERLHEIKQELWDMNINASIEWDKREDSLEWWDHDGSLCAINFGTRWFERFDFYKNSHGDIEHEINFETVEEFEDFWANYKKGLKMRNNERTVIELPTESIINVHDDTPAGRLQAYLIKVAPGVNAVTYQEVMERGILMDGYYTMEPITKKDGEQS